MGQVQLSCLRRCFSRQVGRAVSYGIFGALILALLVALTGMGNPVLGAEVKLLASDGARGDGFGYSVAISGDYVLVGAIYDDDHGTGSGSAYVYYDTEPPVISHTSDTSATENNSKTISATITDNVSVSSATLYYRAGGASSYDSISMSSTGGNTYQGTIPAGSVTSRSVEYYISAADSWGNTATHPASNPAQSSHCICVRVNNLVKPEAQPTKSYRMVSFPINLDNKSPANVLADDLGSYDNTRWRLFRYQGNGYVEYPNTDNFAPGKGSWLITREAKTIDSGLGRSVTTASDFQITLQQGWNQIGNPFNFTVAWDSVTWAGGSIENKLYGYDGSSYVLSSKLEPFKGYFVKSLGNNVALKVPPRESSGSARVAKAVSTQEYGPGEWPIQIVARAGRFKDAENYLGNLRASAEGWDPRDFSEPPPIGDYVSLYFPHRDWAKYPGLYSGDFRPVSEKGRSWDFEVVTNVRDQSATLEFKGVESVPAGFEVRLIDKDLKIAKDLRTEPSYSFPSYGTAKPRHFRLLVGTPGYVNEKSEGISAIPTEFELSQNFPNPFNAATTIRYALPVDGKVTLTIYNILGQKVKTLIDGQHQPADYYLIQWDGKNEAGLAVASGVYFYRLNVEALDGRRWSEVKKMVLVK